MQSQRFSVSKALPVLQEITPLTNVTEEDREEHQTMERTKDNQDEVHPEVEHPEDLRARKSQHGNPDQLRQGDATEPGNHERKTFCRKSTAVVIFGFS